MWCRAKAALTELFTRLIRWDESQKDIEGTMAICEPGGLDFQPRPHMSWDDVILPKGLAEEIKGNIQAFFKSSHLYAEMGMPHKRGLLFSGPPGNGKTLTARIIASDRNYRFCWLKLTEQTNDAIVSFCFKYAHEHSPCVLLIEDLDRMTRNGGVTMSNILNQLDGLSSGEGILVIATTNAPEKLDPALVHRPSRFDRIWKFPLPSKTQQLALLKRLGTKYFSNGTIEKVAVASNGFSMAYTQEIITNALLIGLNTSQELNDSHLLLSLDQLKGQYQQTAACEGLGRKDKAEAVMGFGIDATDGI